MKSPNPNFRVVGHRNLSRRIQRLLDGIEGADRAPDQWEVHHILNALGLMTVGDFYEGEHAMMLAERELGNRGNNHQAAVDASTERATLQQLRDRLAEALAGRVE